MQVAIEDQWRLALGGGNAEAQRGIAVGGGALALVACVILRVCTLYTEADEALFHGAAHVMAGRTVVPDATHGAHSHTFVLRLADAHLGACIVGAYPRLPSPSRYTLVSVSCSTAISGWPLTWPWDTTRQ